MRGNYKVRVRVPIYATAEIECTVFGVDDDVAAIREAQETIFPAQVATWFETEWNPNHPIPSLAEVIEFEATETDTTTKEESKE